MSDRIVSIEMNEINFDFIQFYIDKGHLENFARVLKSSGLTRTRSEAVFTDIEPWIQWPTYYTGKTLEEHRIYRLGDSVDAQVPQIWEKLEQAGKSVAAISPMNAVNRCAHPAFFVPDPWTITGVSGGRDIEKLYAVIRKAVNENAHSGGMTAGDAVTLVRSILGNARPDTYARYVRLFNLSRKYKWAKALFLDQLLADVFISNWRTSQPDYSSLFLNAGAHIQHHHMYESAVYEGAHRNPEWYSASARDGVDPLLIAYRAYDRILGDFLKLDDVRLMITTGLSQVPNQVMKYQYRFKSHAATLARVGVDDATVIPRMSRDFLLEFGSSEAATAAQARLARLQCAGADFIEIDNRGTSLFCKICYFGPPEGLEDIQSGDDSLDLREDITLVSIENGIHQTTGFHVDTGASARNTPDELPLASLHDKVLGIWTAAS